MPELAINNRIVDFLLNRFEINSCSLMVGDDIMIHFTQRVFFFIILGLHHIVQPVDLDLKIILYLWLVNLESKWEKQSK